MVLPVAFLARLHIANSLFVKARSCIFRARERVATNGRYFTLQPWARRAPFSPGLAQRPGTRLGGCIREQRTARRIRSATFVRAAET